MVALLDKSPLTSKTALRARGATSRLESRRAIALKYRNRIELGRSTYDARRRLGSCSKEPIGAFRDRIWFHDGSNLYAIYAYSGFDPSGTTVIRVRPAWFNQAQPQKVPQFPFPKIPKGVCAGTDCVEGEGITTEYNHIDPDPDCEKYCKYLLVSTHEDEHRKNMGPCCDKRNKCIANNPPIADICQKMWIYWKEANRLDLEQRAAVETCKLARNLKKNCRCVSGGPGDTWWDCCEIAKAEEPLACGAADVNAPITDCPFGNDGTPNMAVLDEILEKIKSESGVIR